MGSGSRTPDQAAYDINLMAWLYTIGGTLFGIGVTCMAYGASWFTGLWLLANATVIYVGANVAAGNTYNHLRGDDRGHKYRK